MARPEINIQRIALPADGVESRRFRLINDNFLALRDQIDRLTQNNGLITVGDISHGDLDDLTDDDHPDYHTDARALIWLGTRSTTDLPEGTNLYYTDVRWDTKMAAADTGDLAEGSNLYYTDARWQTAFGLKDLADLLSGTSGDIIYYDGADWVVLAKGTDTQVLTLASGIPSWAASGGGGGTTSYVSSGSIGWIWVGGFPLEIA